MTGLLSTAANAVAFVLLVKVGADQVGYTTWRVRRFPRAAAALVALVAVPSMAQLLWPAVAHALDRQPAEILHHGQVWRLVTAAFVQDGALSGMAFNLVSLAVIASLGEWCWGARRAVAIFLGAAVLFNVQGVLFDASGAGTSGATFALGASLAGVVLVAGAGRRRMRALACPVFGAVMLAFGNIHGLALIYGTVIGVVLHARGRRGCR